MSKTMVARVPWIKTGAEMVVTDSDAALLEAVVKAADAMRGNLRCCSTGHYLDATTPPLRECCTSCEVARAYDTARAALRAEEKP